MKDIWTLRPGFYSEFRYKSREHSGLAWGAILRKVFVLTLFPTLPCSFFQEHVPRMHFFPKHCSQKGALRGVNGLFSSISRPPGRQNESLFSISRFPGHQNGSCFSISRFTGHQNASFLNISRFTSHQNASFSNISRITANTCTAARNI